MKFSLPKLKPITYLVDNNKMAIVNKEGKLGYECSRTDFSFLSDYFSDEGKSYYGYFSNELASIDLYSGNITSEPNSKACYLRPTMKVDDSKSFIQSHKNYFINFDGRKVQAVEYGYYPQKRVYRSINNILERLYSNNKFSILEGPHDKNKLKITDNKFTTNNRYDEYEYKGKRYIRVEVFLEYGKYYNYKNSDYIWIEVSPIVWLYDSNNDEFISRDMLVGGIDKDNVESYLKDSFADQISQDIPFYESKAKGKNSNKLFKNYKFKDIKDNNILEGNKLLELIFQRYPSVEKEKIIKLMMDSNNYVLRSLAASSSMVNGFSTIFNEFSSIPGYNTLMKNYFSNPNLSKNELIEYYKKNDENRYNVLYSNECPSSLIYSMIDDLIFDKSILFEDRMNVFIRIASHKNSTSFCLKKAEKKMKEKIDFMRSNNLMSNRILNLAFNKFLYAYLSNPNCPNSKIDEYYNERWINDYVAAGIIKNPNCSFDEYLELLNNRLRGYRPFIQDRIMERAIVSSPHCKREYLDEIVARDSLDNSELYFSCSPLSTEKELHDLSLHINSNELTYRLVSNPNCPLSILDKVAKSEYLLKPINEIILSDKTPVYLYEAIINNPNCTKELFEYIIRTIKTKDEKTTDPDVLTSLILNSNRTKEILDYIIKNGSSENIQARVPDLLASLVLNSDMASIELMEEIFEFDLDDTLGLRKEENNIIDEKLLEEQRIKEGKEQKVKDVINSLNNLMASIEALQKFGDENALAPLYHKYTIDDDILLVKVENHYEIKSEFIPVLRFLNLSFTRTKDLKVSGIDFRGTNIQINPQNVYNKDLSYSKFDDNNITGSLAGCILIGTDISSESFLVGINEAIIDDNTKLPNSKKGAVL